MPAPVHQLAASRLREEFGLSPVIATEIEFYLLGNVPEEPSWWDALLPVCEALGVRIFKYERERGEGQFEVALAMTGDVADIIRQTEAFKDAARMAAKRLGLEVAFTAKPFTERPGSGLHIHVHLERDGQNVFFKRDEEISDELKFSIGGLLATLPETMAIYAPSRESYARFVAGGTAPTTISWGANNRTVAIRLPDIGAPYRHIEHRVSGADANVADVIAAVLQGIYVGLKEKCVPTKQTYGDASLPQYDLKPLPATLDEARKLAAGKGRLLLKYGF